jgi:catechol 2,3-dioxygenase-like lactoylglutathione lyase family enzyme
MIDHTGVQVSDFERSKTFYSQALKPIGYQLLLEFPASVTGRTNVAGFGEAPKADFWIAEGTANEPRIHVAFRVRQRFLVDDFHHAALAAGAKDHGAPGLRPQYHSNYYGAFVLDPDGHNIEVVCHEAE